MYVGLRKNSLATINKANKANGNGVRPVATHLKRSSSELAEEHNTYQHPPSKALLQDCLIDTAEPLWRTWIADLCSGMHTST
jgi:hypothetical protein